MQNNFMMIDVGAKRITHRLAIAKGAIKVGANAFMLIKDKKLPKGDALILAEIAGIGGAKRAFEMIPLCHPLGLEQVKLQFELDENNHSIIAYCIASTHAKTGIEMEVLAGVNAALLTIWDLTKMVEPCLEIGGIELLLKLGGKSGVYQAANCPQWINDYIPKPKQQLLGRKIAILTLSDRAHSGVYEDKSGQNLQNICKTAGGEICFYKVIPDDGAIIKATINEIIKSENPHLILCTGGTGVAPRDFTPETILPMLDKVIDGVGELLRQDGAKYTPLSYSSRAIGGMIGQSLIITLPGNPKAVIEGMDALLPALLPHLIKTMRSE